MCNSFYRSKQWKLTFKPTSKEYSDTIIKLLNDNVLYGPNRKFNYNAFKALYTGKNKARQIEVLMQTTPFSKIPNWKNFRRELVDVYESLYGDVMKIKKLIRDDIDIDHLVTLRSTMPIYNNVEFGSDLWVKIQQRFLQKNYQPGNTIANLNALSPEVHQVKTNFFNKTLGKDGSKFFNKKIPYKGGFIRRKDYMKLSDENRLEILDQLIRRIDEGTRVLDEARTVWKLLYAKGEVMPEALVERILLNFSEEGDTIYDPFMGTGTTGVVAKRLNRNFIGSELVKSYYDTAQKRLDRYEYLYKQRPR